VTRQRGSYAHADRDDRGLRWQVGVPVGPEVAILDQMTNQPLPPGRCGQIALRGGALFRGYLDSSSGTEDHLDANGWFHTGDLGHFDENGTGCLTLDGRSKEVIMRGGEMLSPMEIEAAVLTHPSVLSATVFAVPHTHYQVRPPRCCTAQLSCVVLPQHPTRPSQHKARALLTCLGEEPWSRGGGGVG
jgi:acyl-CoA synthetase (AMP-forming)/AMP-acid ligase II